MKTSGWIKHATSVLVNAGVTTARLDCLVLLEDVLNTNRTHILAHPEYPLTDENIAILNIAMEKRAQHIPLAYIRGKTEFYGREFAINERVLEPRPESETIIDLLKNITPQPQTIIDIGTGSGALAITAKLELPDATVYAADIDAACLMVAKLNTRRLHANVTFLRTNLLDNLPQDTLDARTILLCNLPYVPDGFHINTAALHEPKQAIFGGPDGLGLYRALFAQLSNLTTMPRFILAESMPPQHQELSTIAMNAGYQQVKIDDFIQLFESKSSSSYQASR